MNEFSYEYKTGEENKREAEERARKRRGYTKFIKKINLDINN